MSTCNILFILRVWCLFGWFLSCLVVLCLCSGIKLPVILPGLISNTTSSSAAVTSPASLLSLSTATERILAEYTLNATIPHTLSFSLKPSSPATSTVATQTLPLLANSSTALTKSVMGETLSTTSMPTSFTQQEVNTDKWTGMPTSVFTTPVTLNTRTAVVSKLPTKTTTSLYQTTKLFSSTSLFEVLSTAMSHSLEKQKTTESDFNIMSVITTKRTTESMSPSSVESFLRTTTNKPVTIINTTMESTASSTVSTQTESKAINMVTSATTAYPTVTFPLQTLLPVQPHSGMSTQKTTSVNWTETRQPSVPSSPTAQKMSTYSTVSPTQTSNKSASVSTSQTEKQTVTYEVRTEMASEPTKILNLPSTSTSGIMPAPSTTYTNSWSTSVLSSQATSATQIASTYAVSSVPVLTSNKAILTETVNKITPVSPTRQTHTTFPALHNLLTHTTPQTSSQLVGNSSVHSTVTTSASNESFVSTLNISSTSSHFTEKINTLKTELPSISLTPATTESNTLQIDHANITKLPALTTMTSASASSATSSLHEPQLTTSVAMNMFSSHKTLSSETVLPQTEMTHSPPHTGRSELSTTTSTQPVWSSSKILPTTERVTKRVTPLLTSQLSTTRTPEITKIVQVPSPAVTETHITVAVTDNLQLITEHWIKTKTTSLGSFESSAITNTQTMNMSERITNKSPILTLTSKIYNTSTTDASNSSDASTSVASTSSSSRWPLLSEPTYTVLKGSSASDDWEPTSSQSTTLPKITLAKYRVEQDTQTTLMSTSAKDDSPSQVCMVCKFF